MENNTITRRGQYTNMKHNDELRHWQATTLACYDTGMLRHRYATTQVCYDTGMLRHWYDTTLVCYDTHTHITTTARPYTRRHNKSTLQSKTATNKETRRQESRHRQDGMRRKMRDDRWQETRWETLDEELTNTEPHECAFIHWGKSQSTRELGTWGGANN